MEESVGNDFLERIKVKAIERIEKKLQWGEEFASEMKEDGKVPFPAQIMRVYEMVENGTKRVVLADATGFGKTYVSTMIFGLLNKRKGRKNKVLLIAPKQSINSAWKESEINDYLNGLGINKGRPLRIKSLENEALESGLDGTDILCINYEKFSCSTSERYVNAVLDMAKNLDVIILDEGQNADGPKRRKNIEKLVQSTLDKRFMYLSATPGQNGLEDLGMALHIIDPENFPLAEYNDKADPTAIGDMIATGRWFNSDRETVAELFNLPPLKIHSPVYCNIGGYYAKRYLGVWENGDLSVMHKIAQMRKYLVLGKLKSKEGRAELENLLENIPENRAVIGFADLKEGREGLFRFLKSFYGGKNVAYMGDNAKIDKRIEIPLEFKEGKYKAIVGNYNISIIKGNRPLHCLFFDAPMNYTLDQAIGSVWRPGQEGKVFVQYVLGKNEWLQEKMEEIKESGVLQRKYGVGFSNTWRNTLIDSDAYDIMRTKDRIINKIKNIGN